MFEQLRRSTTAGNLLARAVGASVNGITIADALQPGRPLIFANAAFLELTGYALDEVIGRNCSLLQGDDRAQAGVGILKQAFTGHVAATVLLRNYKKNGKLFMNELTVSPVVDERGQLTHYIGVQHDVTERERLAAQVSLLNASLADKAVLLQAQNDELEAFSAAVSHDLRTPLAAIDVYRFLLAGEPVLADCASTQKLLAGIDASVRQSERMIEALLNLAKASRTPIQRTACDLTVMCRQILARLAQQTPGRTVHTAVEPGLLALADADLIERVVENLLANAWKFTRDTPGARVEVGMQTSANGTNVIHVRDNGAGFDMVGVGRLFRAFERLHPVSDFEGTGIGLALVDRVVRRHGGKVWCTAEVGRGATFFFTTGPALP